MLISLSRRGGKEKKEGDKRDESVVTSLYQVSEAKGSKNSMFLHGCFLYLCPGSINACSCCTCCTEKR